MSSVVDTPGAPLAPLGGRLRPGRRRSVAVVVAVAVVAGVVAVVVARPTSVTQGAFAAFAAPLDTVPAPQGSFRPYDPQTDGNYGVVPQDAWMSLSTHPATSTWINTADSSWWVAIRGWTTTSTSSREAATCQAVLRWLAASGTALGLGVLGGHENAATCRAAFDSVRSTAGLASEAWTGRGFQTADGRPRFQTGVEMFTGPAAGQVIVRVEAVASVSHP